jgi:hypothetical protein
MELAFLAFDSDAGVVTHFGAQASQGIEQGSLSAIRIAG